jgi:hypothetical protein
MQHILIGVQYCVRDIISEGTWHVISTHVAYMGTPTATKFCMPVR